MKKALFGTTGTKKGLKAEGRKIRSGNHLFSGFVEIPPVFFE
jgi:hypothetical protein